MKKLELALWVGLSAWAGLAIWPASYWYNAGLLQVRDTRLGQGLVLDYDGGAVRPFLGSYSVVVRDLSQSIVGEDRSGIFQYRADAQRPSPLTIEWWAPGDERMHALPVGAYRMETCWTVHDAFWGIVPSKTTCATSNIFSVTSFEKG